jgi:DNA-binding CsgD family transcriptional regulator
VHTTTSRFGSEDATALFSAAYQDISRIITACSMNACVHDAFDHEVYPRLQQLIPHRGFTFGTFILRRSELQHVSIARPVALRASSLDPEQSDTASLVRRWLQARQPVFMVKQPYSENLADNSRTSDDSIQNIVLHAVTDARDERGFFLVLANVECWSCWEVFLLQILLPHLQGICSALINAEAHHGQLTAREKEVLEWVCQGKSNQEIATILGISTWTVKVHVGNVLCKLNATTRGHAAAKALSGNLVQMAMRGNRKAMQSIAGHSAA